MNKDRGICKICACTEADACDDGCGWADRAHHLCTACKGSSDEARTEKRETNLADLQMRHETLVDEVLELRHRIRLLDAPLPPRATRKARRTKPSQHPKYPNAKAAT